VSEFLGMPHVLRAESISVATGTLTVDDANVLIITRAENDRLRSDADTRGLTLRSFDPPQIPEFLLQLCAQTKHQKAELGDLNETFNRNCARWGRARATRLYWAEALQSLLPLLLRAIGRVVKWAAILDAIKRHFLS
jgi:hypothetical protein